jgi:hypothetical protein
VIKISSISLAYIDISNRSTSRKGRKGKAIFGYCDKIPAGSVPLSERYFCLGRGNLTPGPLPPGSGMIVMMGGLPAGTIAFVFYL